MDQPACGLLVDLSTAGRSRTALIPPGGHFDAKTVRTHLDSDLSTLTAVFVETEREAGFSLKRAQVVIAIPGVPGRDVITIMRSRWTLSRAGLEQFFGRPVTIVNDGAAKAWATMDGADRAVPLGDTKPLPALRKLSRRLLVQFEAGLGAAVIDCDADQAVHVFETEAGHMGFAPCDEFDDRLLAELRASLKPASWEHVLRVAQGSQPSALFASMPADQRHERLVRWSADFVAETVLATCAWDGVYLTGSGFAKLTGAASGRPFMTRVSRNRTFRRHFEALGCWHLEQENAVLRGCAQILLQARDTD